MKRVYLVASGDQRPAANIAGWPTQKEMEEKLKAALSALGVELVRAHPEDPQKGHGFIDSQRMGLNVFNDIPKDAPVIVALSIWQFSHHVLGGLQRHQGPVLTVANFSGEWPGLVGLLNLNGGLTKLGRPYSTLWSKDFNDDFFQDKLAEWVDSGRIEHDLSHVHSFDPGNLPAGPRQLGRRVAEELKEKGAILGVFDEGCMGMQNAIVEDALLNRLGIFKERLSQSALYVEMQRVDEKEAEAALEWLLGRGMKFRWGEDPASELTREQTLEQLKMYIAAARMADRFAADAIGIQYQLGMIELTAASDLAEGLLNNPDRPPIYAENGRELYAGRMLPHFNEADEGAGIDGLVTERVWRALGLDPANTLHDLRWGDEWEGSFVWVLMISGAAPAAHLTGGYAGTVSERQPPVYFKSGGGTMTGVGRPGQVVWSRIYPAAGELHADLGLGTVLELPPQEVDRRWQSTTPQWPQVNVVFTGVDRDRMMARHKANHVQLAYADGEEAARTALIAKAAALDALGVKVHFCGVEP